MYIVVLFATAANLLILYVASEIIGGAGHGWVSAYFLSIPAIVLAPIITLRSAYGFINGRVESKFDFLLLICCLVLDIALLICMWNERGNIREILGGGGIALVAVWITAWLAWQVPFFIAFGCLKSNSRAAARQNQTQ
ncbi:MAG: hypothetical protein M3Z24_14070 [Chloroflexota bacterium]|nr:hypothetical protein [Chloroflexota bacterium]